MQSTGGILSRKDGVRAFALGSLSFVLLLFLAACQPVQPPAASASSASVAAEIPKVTITVSDSSFDVPAEIPAGIVSLTLKNEGEASHHAIIGRMFDDVTLDQVGEMLAQED